MDRALLAFRRILIAALVLAGSAAPAAAQRGQNVDIPVDDDVKVRFSRPPRAYDEKGHIRKRTPQELKELKGPDPKLPGYTADLGDLKDGQVVTVRLARVQTGKDGKNQFTSVGTVSGPVVHSNGSRKKGTDKGEEVRTITVRAVAASLRGYGPKKGDEALRAIVIEIHNQD